jgi:FkbH-like protein
MEVGHRSSADNESGIKCVVWDLDNTLWQGTLLEGDDLVLTPGITDVIHELDNRGILLSIASKNDYSDAWIKVAGFGLDEFFLHPQIGWRNKSDSIKIIADKLRIALDSFAFVDDQAFELAEVQYYLPEVLTVDAHETDRLLDMSRMRPRFITNESRMRRQIYQADIRRTQGEIEFAGTGAEFLETLGQSMTIRTAGEHDLRRAEELTLRTNQLNTTGRTYSYEALSRLSESSDHLLLVADLKDRYGDNGTVGLALIEQRTNLWLVKLLITSCRVMTRGIGGAMISYILQSARRNSVKLYAEFVANDRNRMMYIAYRFSGFYEISECDDCIVLKHDLESIHPFPRHLVVDSPSDESNTT